MFAAVKVCWPLALHISGVTDAEDPAIRGTPIAPTLYCNTSGRQQMRR
jgi:hypothetical protein